MNYGILRQPEHVNESFSSSGLLPPETVQYRASNARERALAGVIALAGMLVMVLSHSGYCSALVAPESCATGREGVEMAFVTEGVHHVGVTVSDLERSLEWYSRIFGFDPGPINTARGRTSSAAFRCPLPDCRSAWFASAT